MRKAFTLIEMLIVIAVLTTLMTIVFRLSSIGGDSWRRSETITRIQKLENCLSGYYAAFGSYPPVKLHGSRSINFAVGGDGVQTDTEQEPPWNDEGRAWRQVRAACMAQPVECNFPFSEGYAEIISSMSELLKQIVSEKTEGYEAAWNTEEDVQKFSAGFDDGNGAPIDMENSDWRNVQLFRFGVLSYLLPRYLVMMGARDKFYDSAQWESNNEIPSDPFTGDTFNDWRDMKSNVKKTGQDYARIANIGSQAACARWMPNLEEICTTVHNIDLFGIRINHPNALDVYDFISMPIFSPGGSEGNKDQYVLDFVALHDGWGHPIYYYSPSPYQRYTVWSAGPDGKTFPPWVSRETLSTEGNRMASKWTKDDIGGLRN